MEIMSHIQCKFIGMIIRMVENNLHKFDLVKYLSGKGSRCTNNTFDFPKML